MKDLISFSDFIQFPVKCLKVFGLIAYDADSVETWKKKFLRIYHYIVITNLLLGLCWMSIFAHKNYRNLLLMTETLPPSGYALLAIIKSISIFLRRDEFKDLMETLSDVFPKTRHEQNLHQVRMIFKSYKKMERIFSAMVGSAAINFVVVPVLRFIITREWYGKLPFNGWYPFDEYDPKYYNFVFLWHFFNIIITIASLLGPDLILYAFITLISMQFKILCYRFKDLKNVSSSEVYGKFVELVKVHETLIRLSTNLQRIYSISILFNFTGSSILICLIGYQASKGINLENLVKFLIFLTASLVQVFMLCNHGNKLSEASNKIADAAFSSGWNEKENRNLRNPLLLVVQRSQKTNVITAYKFSVVSLEAFTSVRLSSLDESKLNKLNFLFKHFRFFDGRIRILRFFELSTMEVLR